MMNIHPADRMRSVLVLVATIATIVYNGLAAAGQVNGVTPGVVSELYPTVVTPAGYAFSIWSLIYVGLVAFSIFQLLPRNAARFQGVRSLYIISCALNCAWIYFWHHEQIAVCLGVIAALIAALLIIIRRLAPDMGPGGALFAKVPFGIYGGWVMSASLVNFSVLLTYLDVSFSNTVWNSIGVTLLLLAAAVAAAVRLRLKNYVFPLSVAWAATAIAIKQSSNTAIIVSAAICVIICLIAAISFVMDQKTFDYENG